MIAIAECPHCKELVKTDCEACIKYGDMVHFHKENTTFPDTFENIKWRVIEK